MRDMAMSCEPLAKKLAGLGCYVSALVAFSFPGCCSLLLSTRMAAACYINPSSLRPSALPGYCLSILPRTADR